MENSEAVARSGRNPDQTRQRILQAAFMEMYRSGFQGMRLDEVIAATQLTKGALYHHFPNKRALGYAVVDEMIIPTVDAVWLQPLKNAADPLQGLIDVIEQMPDNEHKPPEMKRYGCPLNNLAQEMSPLDEGFRQRLDYAVSGRTLFRKPLNAHSRRGIFVLMSIVTKPQCLSWPLWKVVSAWQKMRRAWNACTCVTGD